MRLLATVSIATVMALCLLPGRAEAHAEYQRSNPPADGVVQAIPPRLDVWFTAELFRRTGENRLEVTGPGGMVAHVDTAVIDDADRTHLSVGLKAGLPSGIYTVKWATLSAQDGENAEGVFTFRVDPTASASTPSPAVTVEAAATVTSTATSPPDTATAIPGAGTVSRFPWWALGVAAAIALSGTVVAVTILRGGARP